MSTRLRCFVIMPYSHESDLLYRATILPVLNDLPGADILALRADEMGERPLTLKAHVETAVQSADFCIVDLSGVNANVVYELGYVMALRKPTVMVMAHNSGRLPSNLEGTQILYYSPNDAAAFRSSLARECERIVSALKRSQEIKTHEIESSKSVVAEPIVSIAFDRLVESVESKFSALVHSSSSLARNLFPKLRHRIATKERGIIRVVCANPEGSFAGDRALMLNRSRAIYRQEMWAAIDLMRSEFDPIRGWNAELRLTDLIVSSSIYLSDSIALFIPQMLGARARQYLTFRFDKDQNLDMFVLLQQQFDEVWSSATQDKAVPGRSVSLLSDDDF